MDLNDEYASLALGYKDQVSSLTHKVTSNLHPDIKVRYSGAQILDIYKSLGRFEHPLNCLERFKLQELNPENLRILRTLTSTKADVVLEIVKADI